MQTVAGMTRKLEAYNLNNEITIVLNNGKKELFLIQKEQWLSGDRATGQKIGKYANAAYAKAKSGMNPKAGSGYMDLILTGDTINSLKIEVSADVINYELQSDEHALVNRFGKDILGMNTEGRYRFIEDYFRTAILKSLKTKTGMQ
jgi:hypothetical protein